MDQFETTELCRDEEFAATIDHLIREYEIEEIIETGTFLGTGSSQVFAKTGLPLHTIECHPVHFLHALRNLDQYPNVRVLHGYSLSLKEMLDFIQQNDYQQQDHLYVDVPPEQATSFYTMEVDHGPLKENLLPFQPTLPIAADMGFTP